MELLTNFCYMIKLLFSCNESSTIVLYELKFVGKICRQAIKKRVQAVNFRSYIGMYE